MLAEKLGLPGNDPRAVITAQHKFYARTAYARVAPEATPRFAAFPYTVRHRDQLPFELPCFVKPVKATYSVLARRIDHFEQLRRHLSFWPFEKFLIKRLVKPFNDLMAWYTDYRIDAHHMIAEELLEGVQVNLDGYVHQGEVRVLGIIDENMYPGTQAFASFEYPSRVPEDVRGRMTGLAARVLRGIGYRHGFFNMELMWQPETGRLHIIGINPRMASQLAFLYEAVDGVNPYRVALDLALGEAPRFEHAATAHRRAASFALRKFDGKPLAAEPTRETLAQVPLDYPDARLLLYPKRGPSLPRELKWLGRYRYPGANMGAPERRLHRRLQDMRSRLSGVSQPSAARTAASRAASMRRGISAPSRRAMAPASIDAVASERGSTFLRRASSPHPARQLRHLEQSLEASAPGATRRKL